MLADLFNNPVGFVFFLLSLIAAITVHEFAHAWAAEHLGDPTPRLLGRLTLNPLAHLDPVGSLLMLVGGFGWGKPVPFDPFNLRNPRRDSAIISLAGPLSNMAVAGVCSAILRVSALAPDNLATVILTVLCVSLIRLNVSLAIFNLVPIHPLDGFAIVEGMLPRQYAREWATLKSLGFIMLLVLVFPLFGHSPVLAAVSSIVNTISFFLIP